MLLDNRTAWAGMLLAGISLTCQRVHAVTPACLTHKAAAGDTLIGLSRQHLIPSAGWRELARLNHVAHQQGEHPFRLNRVFHCDFNHFSG